MSYLVVNDLSHAFETKSVLQSLSFTLEKGEIASLLGFSGSGKTTALRCIAGFETPQAGVISLNQQPLLAKGVCVPAHERHIGMVFQDYALFPHLNVFENIGFGLPKKARNRSSKIQEILELVGLPTLGKRYPHELSGGQQQRVALARALVMQPAMLLLDEPFSSLDVSLRSRLAEEVRAIIKSLNMTAILVTHDQSEAFAFSDQVGVLHEGKLQQFASPYEVYHQPANRFTAEFIGESSWLKGALLSENVLQTEVGKVKLSSPCSPVGAATFDVLIRPDDVVEDASSTLQAIIESAQFRGAEWMYQLRFASGASLKALLPSYQRYAVGTKIGVRLIAPSVVAFPHSIN